MNKPWCTKIAFCGIILTIGIWCSWTQAQPVKSEQKSTSETGRDNPFADFISNKKPTAAEVPQAPRPVEEKPELFLETVTLKFLDAGNLRAALASMSSKYGGISIDEKSNSLIVCDTKENLEKILTQIRKADKEPPQIMIEVVIIDVQLKNDTEIGIDWDILSSERYSFAYRQSMVYPERLAFVASDDDTRGNGTAFMATGGPGGEIAVVSGTVRNVIHLLQEKRNVDILASPRVMVVSGQKADIKTVQEIPYQEVTQSAGGGGGINAVTSTQFKEVGVALEVKATVTDNGKILLAVKPKQSASTGVSISNVPVVNTREASTTLLMDEGKVAVMGGLRRQDTQIIKYRIPLLGDLPLIGFIFSDDRKIVENSELLVLLSPHIYRGEQISADVMAKYNQIKDKTLLSPPDQTQSQSSEQAGEKSDSSDKSESKSDK